MKKFIVSLAVVFSFLPMLAFAKQPTPPTVVIHCVVNPLYGTPGQYQPYIICTITRQ